jgi:hypothetical protein
MRRYFRILVETLSDKQQVVPYAEERFSTWNQALAGEAPQ